MPHPLLDGGGGEGSPAASETWQFGTGFTHSKPSARVAALNRCLYSPAYVAFCLAIAVSCIAMMAWTLVTRSAGTEQNRVAAVAARLVAELAAAVCSSSASAPICGLSSALMGRTL